MKTVQLFFTLLLLTFMANMSAYAQSKASKSLVVWYSWGGNTKAVGEYIQQFTGADTFVIEPVKNYSSDYTTCTEEAKEEINANRTRPIKGRVEHIDAYDVIYIGTPNWWSTMAPPVLEFLRTHNLEGKTVVPFITHGGGREARCVTDMKKAAPGANFANSLVVSGSRAKNSQAEVERWLNENVLKK